MTSGRLRSREWWGLPRLTGHGGFVAAVLVDSLGSGVFLPFSVIYFVRSTPLSLTTVGACLSAAALAAIVAVPVAGPAIDRFGPGRSVVLSNLMQAAGFFAYLRVGSAWQLTACAFLVAAGQNVYWTASGPAVLAVAEPGERDRWFSLIRVLRNLGLGAGTLISAVVAVGAGVSIGRALVLANGLSFIVAAVLATTSLPMSPATEPDAQQEGRPSRRLTALTGIWRDYVPVLRDLRFLTVAAANVLLALCTMVMPVILTVYVTDFLHLAGWFAGALFTTNAVIIAGTQTVFSRRLEHLAPLTVLQLSAFLWALCFIGFWTASASVPAVAMVVVAAGVLCFTAAEMAHAPTMGSVVARLAPESAQGRYFAVYQLSWAVPTAFAPLMFTELLHFGQSWLWGVLVIVCLGSAGLLRARRLPENGIGVAALSEP